MKISLIFLQTALEKSIHFGVETCTQVPVLCSFKLYTNGELYQNLDSLLFQGDL
jgi:hypothetical protein